MKAGIETLAAKNDPANLKKDISETGADTIKWMFIFWIGQIGAMITILLLVAKNKPQGVVTATGNIFPLKKRWPVSANSAIYFPISKAITGDSYPGNAFSSISV